MCDFKIYISTTILRAQQLCIKNVFVFSDSREQQKLVESSQLFWTSRFRTLHYSQEIEIGRCKLDN